MGEKSITTDEIKLAVASHFRITCAEIDSRASNRRIARPRQIAMYLARTLTNLDYLEIGFAFGKRRQSLVGHAIGKIDHLLPMDPVLEEDLRTLRAQLELKVPANGG